MIIELGEKGRERGKRGAEVGGGGALLVLTSAGTASLPLFFLSPVLLPSFSSSSSSSAHRAVISMQRSTSLCSAVWVCLNARFLAHCCMSDGKGIALQCWLHTILRARTHIHNYTHTHSCSHIREKNASLQHLENPFGHIPDYQTLPDLYLNILRPLATRLRLPPVCLQLL